MKDRRQIWIVVGLVAYFILGYLPINALTEWRGVFYDVGLPFEENIPFTAPFILGYLIDYAAVVFIAAVIPDWEIFKKMAWGFFWVTTVSYLVFLAYPVKMLWRPEITDPKGIFEWLSMFIFSIDKPFNCFPSLHVAYPTLATVLSWRFIPKWRLTFLAMALITAVSVVMVKQHYLLDAVAGALLALAIGVFIPRRQVSKTPTLS